MFHLETGNSAGLLPSGAWSTLPGMRDLFTLLGHLLTTIAKLLHPGGASAGIGGLFELPLPA